MNRALALIKDSGVQWYNDDAPRKAAALAYYTLLSTAPLVMFSVTIAAAVFGDDAARGQIAEQIGAVVGPQAANAIQNVVKNADQSNGGAIGSIIGLIVLLVGASGVFGELQTTLNDIWHVKPKPGRGVKGFLKDRFLSFTMVLAVAFLLLVSLVISTVLAAMGRFLAGALPGGEGLWQILNFVISLAIITGLFGLMFKTIPDVDIRWRDVWVGAGVTALLFTIGKMLIGIYLGKSSITTSYGAAGSLIALVVWVYYAAQILLLGAEFTEVFARRFGRDIKPDKDAMPADQPTPDEAASKRPAPADPRGAVLTGKHG